MLEVARKGGVGGTAGGHADTQSWRVHLCWRCQRGPARDEIAEFDFEEGRAKVHIARPHRRRIVKGDIDLSGFDGGEDFGVLGEYDRHIGYAEPPRQLL